MKSQARSQKFAMRGRRFRRYKTKLKQFTLGIGTILRPKLGEDQKKEDKRSSPELGSNFVPKFSFSSESKQSHSYCQCRRGEAFSLLEQKLVSKVLTKGYFAFSACQWRRL